MSCCPPPSIGSSRRSTRHCRWSRIPRLAEDIRGFIGQEATHAAAHDDVIRDFLVGNGVDPAPILEMVEYMFGKVLAPTTSTNPKRRLNNLCERLWLIAAIEHYTAVLGDFALNSTWDEHRADPTMVDLFRWHGSEEVEHRSVAHDVAVYFHDSYPDRIRAMTMSADGDLRRSSSAVRGTCSNPIPPATSDGGRCSACGCATPSSGCCPSSGFSSARKPSRTSGPRYTPEQMGSTAQAVAYLATSPAARAAHL